MEIADVRKRIRDTMARARRLSAERRASTDSAMRAFETFLTVTAIPLVRQISNVLRADGYFFSVFTPAGSVRLMSDRSAEDYIDISLDTSGETPQVVAHVSHSRGRRRIEAENIVASGDAEKITEEELFAFLLKELERFVER
jgi:hypothetical protein